MEKNCNSIKIDKGFELIYWKLSYRRKFIRTLWMIPFEFIAVIHVWVTWNSILLTLICFIVIIGTGMAQAIYTYKKWKALNNEVTIKCE